MWKLVILSLFTSTPEQTNQKLKQEDGSTASLDGDWKQAQEAQLNQQNNQPTTSHSSKEFNTYIKCWPVIASKAWQSVSIFPLFKKSLEIWHVILQKHGL